MSRLVIITIDILYGSFNKLQCISSVHVTLFSFSYFIKEKSIECVIFLQVTSINSSKCSLNLLVLYKKNPLAIQ